MQRTLAFGLVLLTVMSASPALSASPYDGVWRGLSTTTHGRCPYRYEVEITIRDGQVRGRMHANFEDMSVHTRVDEAGRMGPVFAANGRTLLKTRGGRLGDAAGKIFWYSQEPDFHEIADVGTCEGVISLDRTSDVPQQSHRPRQ